MLAIDANIFLELLLDQERAQECQTFLARVRDGKLQAVLSDFTVSGIVLVLERHGAKPNDIRTFLLSLAKYEGLIIHFPTLGDKVRATDLMSKHQLYFEDAITLQTAIANTCDALVSYDTDFDTVKGVKRVTPEDIS
jgi:predicted nucleic acid-binding protein